MDQRVVLAVAGSGKTSHIVDSLQSSKRSLIVTYTENNYKNLRDRIARRYSGIPDGIRIYTYFSFLYTFCLRPICAREYSVRGINWDTPPRFTQRIKRNNICHYLDKNGRMYSARIASFMLNKSLVDDVRERIAKYFDHLYVDEVQDFAGYDFNFLCDVAAKNLHTMFVGDFFQHTYDTSRDGNVNRNLHQDYNNYRKVFEQKGFDIDDMVLGNSYRCSPTTCDFVSNEIGIRIASHRSDTTDLEYVDDEQSADEIFRQDNIVKLFYQSQQRYPCYSDNWGASKGIDDYDTVCVVLNKKTAKLFKERQLQSLPPTTKNKLYVACTRARSDLFFVPEKLLTKYKNRMGR